jgi:branched-chain amino acid transport system ATP-binding protein
MTALRVEGLSAGYGRIEVLHGIDLTVGAGELVAVVGANGAGKTTLLRAVSGLLPPRTGTVRLGDQDVTGRPAERLAALGMAHVPEGRLVFPGMSVADNLALGAYVHRRRRTTGGLDEIYELFPRLADRRVQAAGTLSGGEQQMLAIGRGLAAQPRLLLLDEPSLGLAPKLVTEIFAVLATLRDRGDLGVVLVEQNARAALRIADRALVLDRGRVFLEGTPDELLEDARVQAAYLGRGYSEVTA